jgi:RNA polymerase sigma factor (TIGR02999 family)
VSRARIGRAAGGAVDHSEGLTFLAWPLATSRGLTPPTLAGHPGGGYAWPHERRHAHPSAIELGDPHAAEQLLPLVYDELRKLAAQRLAQEKPGQTLQATALVHEAYLRLVDVEQAQRWNSRGHFFAAAAEAMRRILIDNARSKDRLKHGGGMRRVELADAASPQPEDDVLALDEALSRLAAEDPVAARVVELRHFAGLGHEDIAGVLGITVYLARQKWAYARAWLRNALGG